MAGFESESESVRERENERERESGGQRGETARTSISAVERGPGQPGALRTFSYCSRDVNGYGTSFTLYCASPLSRLSEMITFGNFASFRFDMRRSKVAFEIASRASFFVLRRFIVRLLGFRAPSPAQSPHPERPSPPFSVLSFFRFTPRELSSSSISSRIVVSCS